MEVIIQKTKEDYQNFCKYYCFHRKLNQKLFTILLIALIFSADKDSFVLTNYLIKFAIISTSLALVYFIIPYFISIFRLNKALKTKRYSLGKTKITTTDSGINIESESFKALWTWETIKFIEISTDYIFLPLQNNKSSLIIPKTFFHSESEANTFFETIQSELLKAKGLLKIKSGRHLYYWGLIGLLPNFGAIAGLILLYKGLFNYKDKKLVIIGIADILFTILFWLVFTYEMNNGSGFADSDAKFAQTQVNVLVKNIEFWKIQNGSYPDNIKQIENLEQFIWVNDPFLKTNSDDAKNFFHYYKIRDKYTLFSVGKDRLANTSDDIYPTITQGDTIKFGFVKK